jgi:hypothetical protein
MPIGTQHLPLDANYEQRGWWRLLTQVPRLLRVDEMW